MKVCYHCRKGFNDQREAAICLVATLVRNGVFDREPVADSRPLFFHARCFHDLAGRDYIDAMSTVPIPWDKIEEEWKGME